MEESSDRWKEVLKILPPSMIWVYSNYFLILELKDRKVEAEKYFSNEQKQSYVKGGLDEFMQAWKKVEIFFLGFILIALKILFLLFFWLGFVRKSVKKAIFEIEGGISEYAQNFHQRDITNSDETRDETSAKKGVADFENIIKQLKEKFSCDINILSYISKFHSSSQAIGQRWAIAEISCRKAEASADRAEAFWRGGFMIRAFGFGTIKLLRQLLAVLAIGMALPFLLQFTKATPDYSIIKNLAYGIGWTAMLWSITLAITLFLNDRRMSKIWERAKLASLEAKKVRAEELASVFETVKNAVSSCLVDISLPSDKELEKILIADGIQQIKQHILMQERDANRYKEEIERIKTKPSLRSKIKNILDTGSQGDATDQVATGIENIFQ